MKPTKTVSRAALLKAMQIEPCHTTGMHDPNHTTKFVCESQRSKAYGRVLELLGMTEENLPHALHGAECYWCHEVCSQEEYRVDRRALHAWAGQEVPAELAAPAPDAEDYQARIAKRNAIILGGR